MRTRAELGELIGARPPAGDGVLACIAMRWSAPEAPEFLREPAVLPAREGNVLFAARPCRSGTEALLWAEDAAVDAVRTVGLCVERGAVEGAERALSAGEEFGLGPVCGTLLADAVREAARIADEEGVLSHDQRRRKLLRRLVPRLGKVQLEHIAAHGEEVGRAAARLGQLARLDRDAIEHARLAGLLHDIGKLAFPEDMLAKRQGLSPRERAVLARHPRIGAAIAGALGAPEGCVRGVAQHHDRFDAGAPVEARIVCVADALVTMTSARAYSAARSFTDALTELRRGRGTLFDPDMVVAAHLLGAGAMALAA